jgi:hypothetical protein
MTDHGPRVLYKSALFMPDSECSAPAFFKQCVAVSFPLAIIGKTTAQTATEFDRSSRQLLSDCRNTTKQFRDAFADIREMIGDTTEAAKAAAQALTKTFLREYKWSVLIPAASSNPHARNTHLHAKPVHETNQ